MNILPATAHSAHAPTDQHYGRLLMRVHIRSRKRFFCDVCGVKSNGRYRCVDGCDFDICTDCLAVQPSTAAPSCMVVVDDGINPMSS